MGIIRTGKQLVCFEVAEIKTRTAVQEEAMTRAEAFDKAWRLGIKGDFSLVDEIYHPDYKALDAYSGVEVNLEADKEVASTLGDLLIGTHPVVLSEDENFLRIHRYNRHLGAEIFASVTTSITYKDGQIITQHSEVEELDYDPSEGQDWNWEDYE